MTDLADAGIDATITEQGCDDYAPPAVVVGGAHRIIQEALTNAIKHGGPDVAIDVQLICRASQLEIRISNSVNRSAAAHDTTGAGLAGMTERAGVLGGTLDARRVGGRFMVHAVLPTENDPRRPVAR